MIADRDGVHCTSTLKFFRHRPSLANLSSRGVGAPRMIPPPLKPGSPQPKLSMKTRTILGLSCAIDEPVRHTRIAGIKNAGASRFIGACPLTCGMRSEVKRGQETVLHEAERSYLSSFTSTTIFS